MAEAIWTDREVLQVLNAAEIFRCHPDGRHAWEWATTLADYAMAWEGIERTGPKRHLTLPAARRRLLRLARRMDNSRRDAPTTTPEDTLRAAGISSRRQARYQRRMSSLLAGRA